VSDGTDRTSFRRRLPFDHEPKLSFLKNKDLCILGLGVKHSSIAWFQSHDGVIWRGSQMKILDFFVLMCALGAPVAAQDHTSSSIESKIIAIEKAWNQAYKFRDKKAMKAILDVIDFVDTWVNKGGAWVCVSASATTVPQ
jgi:hypothetical protein